jgi:hypothetical protein
MDAADDEDMIEAAGQDAVDNAKQHGRPLHHGSDSDENKV